MILFQFSQLSEDILTALTIVHERKNLLAPINRLPLDVLCLIPTHLASLSDRLRVTFVCRHWRRTFLQYAALWSQLYLTRRTDRLLTKTLLERSKGSPLDITVDYHMNPIPINVTLFSPFAQQIRSLDLEQTFSDTIQGLSMAIPGLLPLLRTLKIHVYRGPSDPPETSGLPLFEGAVNVKNFVLSVENNLLSLRQFAFPNLTTFNFSAFAMEFPVSQLLSFLEASPALQQIRMYIMADRFREDVPPERVIVLSNVKDFSLDVTSDGPGCEIATHISCPLAKHVGFFHELEGFGRDVPKDVYPPSVSWNALARQYTEGTTDRVVLEMRMDGDLSIICSITFGSSDGTTLRLCYFHGSTGEDIEMEMSLERWLPAVFSQALRTIREYPLLGSIRHLHVKGGGIVIHNLGLAAEGVGRLLRSMGPLEKLTLDRCDLRPYLDTFLDTPIFPESIQPTSFPPIKELVIIRPVQSFCNEEVYGAAMVEFARSQEARGMSLERVNFCVRVPSPLVDELVAFVDRVECYGEALSDGDGY